MSLKEGTVVDYRRHDTGSEDAWRIASATIVEVTPKTYILQLIGEVGDVGYLRKLKHSVRASRMIGVVQELANL